MWRYRRSVTLWVGALSGSASTNQLLARKFFQNPCGQSPRYPLADQPWIGVLSSVGQARIVVPIVFRNESQTALRVLSREGRLDLYARTLAYAWRWTAAMPWDDRPAVDGYLAATNAMIDSTDAERSGLRLELP